MSLNQMDTYFTKKKQMSDSGAIAPIDAKTELDKRRASSPVPVRGESRVPTDKKIMYKAEFDEAKKALNDSIDTKLSVLDKTLRVQIDELKTTVETFTKQLEATKIESLKQVLNDSIKQQNANIQDISDELIRHLDKINTIVSKISDIEQLF
jgi:hypothetical protein